MRNIFIEESCRKYALKASPRTPFNFTKYPKTVHARNSFKSKIF